MFQHVRHSLGTPEPSFLNIHYTWITQPIKAKRASEEVSICSSGGAATCFLRSEPEERTSGPEKDSPSHTVALGPLEFFKYLYTEMVPFWCSALLVQDLFRSQFSRLSILQRGAFRARVHLNPGRTDKCPWQFKTWKDHHHKMVIIKCSDILNFGGTSSPTRGPGPCIVSVWWGHVRPEICSFILIKWPKQVNADPDGLLCWKRFVFPICQLRNGARKKSLFGFLTSAEPDSVIPGLRIAPLKELMLVITFTPPSPSC